MMLPADATGRLRVLWDQLVPYDGACVPHEALRSAAQAVGRAARRDGLLPEQAIVAVKESWQREVECRCIDDRVAMRTVLNDLVSLCIVEYFGTAGTRAAPRPVRGYEPAPEPLRSASYGTGRP